MMEQRTLKNGLRLVAEQVNTVRSVSIGILVANGSRYEVPEINGISHFIEHMLFKGTPTRTAKQIADQMDFMGGQGNAFTGKEYTCYYTRVLDTHAKEAIDLLADMLCNASFREEDIARERGVVCEEIDMYEDDPADVCMEKLFQECFAGNALGRSILGTPETLEHMNHDTLRAFVASNYRPADIVVAVSGNYSPADLDYMEALFADMQGEGRNTYEPAIYQPKTLLLNKEIEQNHLCLAFPGVSSLDKERGLFQVTHALLGGGMSSRLFQAIREEQGLCYSIGTVPALHLDCGLLSIYAGTGQGMETRVLTESRHVIEEFCAHGVTQIELDRIKEQLKCNLLMGLESTSSRMMSIARAALIENKLYDVNEQLEELESFTCEQVRDMAGRIFDFSQASLSVVGTPVAGEVYAGILA